MGTERTINFYELSDQSKPILSQKLSNRSLLIMLPKSKCQENFKHGIQPQEAVDGDQFRLCLSFRKVVAPKVLNFAKPQPHLGGYQTQQHGNLDSYRTKQHDNSDGYQTQHYDNVGGYQTHQLDNDHSSQYIRKELLIIGDSLSRGMDFSNTITLTKGGCQVTGVLDVLKNNVINFSHQIIMKSNLLRYVLAQTLSLRLIFLSWRLLVIMIN